MIISFLVIVAVAVSSLYYTNIDSPSGFFSLFLPLVFVASLIALALWLVALFHKTGVNQQARPGDVGSHFNDFGDGGC